MQFLYKKRLGNYSDQQLISWYKESGDKKYIGEIFERYSPLVYGVCLKYLQNTPESKDTVLLIFENLIEELKVYEINNFKTWLYSVTKNRCLMILRKNQKTMEREKKYNAEFPEIANDDDFIIREEQLCLLESALTGLKDEQRVCIELFYLKGMSYHEISGNTGYSFEQVKSYIQNGKRNLKIILEKNEN
ncbi:MAG: sigma-70 family RNA polymerase sigma factor [Bacteroidia bacterium]|nr:sigma-70 family RNA polymerase sigma factor [Bacteroidia bacterium]